MQRKAGCLRLLCWAPDHKHKAQHLQMLPGFSVARKAANLGTALASCTPNLGLAGRFLCCFFFSHAFLRTQNISLESVSRTNSNQFCLCVRAAVDKEVGARISAHRTNGKKPSACCQSTSENRRLQLLSCWPLGTLPNPLPLLPWPRAFLMTHQDSVTLTTIRSSQQPGNNGGAVGLEADRECSAWECEAGSASAKGTGVPASSLFSHWQ